MKSLAYAKKLRNLILTHIKSHSLVLVSTDDFLVLESSVPTARDGEAGGDGAKRSEAQAAALDQEAAAARDFNAWKAAKKRRSPHQRSFGGMRIKFAKGRRGKGDPAVALLCTFTASHTHNSPRNSQRHPNNSNPATTLRLSNSDEYGGAVPAGVSTHR